MSLAWFQLYETHLKAATDSLYYLVVNSGEIALTVLPLKKHIHFGRIRWKVCALANYYSSVFDACIAPNTRHDDAGCEQIAILLVDWLIKQAHPPVIEIAPLRHFDLFWQKFIEALSATSYSVSAFPCFANWFEPVSGLTFRQYWNKRPGILRNTVRRKEAQLNRSAGLEIRITSSCSADTSFCQALLDFEGIYEESWKPPESHPRFLREIMERLLSFGLVKVGILFVGCEPAAGQIWLKLESDWSIFKLAYKPKFYQFSVGSILTSRMLEHVFFVDSPKNIDFLSGDDAYKRDWMSHRRIHWGVEAINPASAIGAAIRIKRMFHKPAYLSLADIGSDK